MLNRRTWLKYLVYLIYYLLLLLLASLHIYITVLVNVALIVLLLKYAKSSFTYVHLYVFVIAAGNLLIFYAMVMSYAELMPWEIGFHTIFYLISSMYFYSFYKSSLLHFDASSKRNVLYFDNKLNSALSYEMYIKFLIFLTIATAYTAQLTFTTLCTPEMYFDWFLVPRDCRLIYSTWFSSICSACGFFSLNLLLVVFLLFINLTSNFSKRNNFFSFNFVIR